MKNKYFLTAVLLLSSFAGFSQSETLFKNSLNVSVGNTKPLDNLAKADLDDTLSGFGKNGLALQIQFNHVSRIGLGIYAQYKIASVGIDEEKVKSEGRRKLGNNAENTRMKTDGYLVNSLNAGLLFVINKNYRFQITPSLGVGLSHCRNRYVEAGFGNGILQGTWEYESDKKISVNALAGINFSYNISGNTAFFLKFESQLQVPKFDYNDKLIWNNIIISEKTRSSTFPMLFSNALVGVSVRM